MLRRLQRLPLLAGAAEVILDAVRCVAIMAVVIVLLGQLVKLAGV
jgi:hypothetical protein